MQVYEGYFENGQFYIKGKAVPVKGRRRAIITILDEPAKETDGKSIKKPRSEARGIFKGKIHMSDDFDEPLEELKKYTMCNGFGR